MTEAVESKIKQIIKDIGQEEDSLTLDSLTRVEIAITLEDIQVTVSDSELMKVKSLESLKELIKSKHA